MKEIIEFLAHFLMIFGGNICYNYCFQRLNNLKLKLNVRNIIIMIIIAFAVYFSNMYIPLVVKPLIVFFIMCINFKLLYNLDLKKTIISYTLIFLILMLTEIIVTITLSIIGVLNNSEGANFLNSIKFFISIIIIFINFLIFKCSKILNLIKKLLILFEKLTDILNFSFLIYLIILIIGVLNINTFAIDYSIQLILCLTVLFGVSFFFIVKYKTQDDFLKKSNEKLIEYNEKYGLFLDEYKVYKHNIKNKLVGMKAYGNKKINSLIDDLLEEETTFSIKNNNLYNVPNGIKGIVAEKLYNINIHAIIDNNLKGDPFIKLQPKEFNSISEAIGICIDNAVEASIETKEPVVLLDLKEDDNYIFIKIGNNFCNDINIEELGDKYYSTKNRNSGLGLFSIMRNKFIKEKISIINNFYYIELKIKKARC